MIAAFLHPWGGTAIRHIPAGSRFDVLDTRFAGLAADNRWNEAGEPTFYLAGDLGVALAEYARHLREDVGVTGTPPIYERAVYRVGVQVEALLDLRDHRVRSVIGLHGGARRFLDRGVARATAHFLRLTTSAEGLLVPSVAFLDDPSRWNLVLFLDKLPADVTSYMRATFHRTVRVSP
ncbi:MAG: RES family NAD+ phosphorylase [Chloroflexota bacterium]|nr:RES family NAD+ phosphorylase [Chloroflexota bacterium]